MPSSPNDSSSRNSSGTLRMGDWLWNSLGDPRAKTFLTSFLMARRFLPSPKNIEIEISYRVHDIISDGSGIGILGKSNKAFLHIFKLSTSHAKNLVKNEEKPFST